MDHCSSQVWFIFIIVFLSFLFKDNGAGFYLGGYGIENSTEYFWFGLNGGPDVAIENGDSRYFWGAVEPDHCGLGGGCCLSLQYDGQKTRLASTNCVDNLMFICVVDV